MKKPVLVDGVILFCFQIACIFFVGREASLHGFPLDDAWIHQVIARNFAEHGSLGFSPGKFGSAATSLLWPFLLSVNFFIDGTAPALFSLVLNICLYTGAGLLVWRILVTASIGRVEALMGAAAFVSAGNFVWFVFSGMEAMLLVLLVLATIYAWERGRDGQHIVVAGLLTVALLFTRIESVFIAGMIVCYEVSKERRSALPRVTKYSGIVLAGLAGLFMLNLLLTGRILPPTLEGRRWMWLLSLNGAWPSDIVALFPLRWVNRLSEFTLGTECPAFFWVMFGVALFGASRLWETRNHGVQMLLLFGVGHLFIYALLLPVEGHGGRYQPFTPALFSLSLCFGMMVLARASLSWITKNPHFLKMTSPGAAFAVVLALMQTTWEWGDFHAKAVKHIEMSEVTMGRYVAALPPGARVASFDIGAIGYFSGKAILDLGALSDPEVLHDLKAGTVFPYLISHAVTHVIVPQGYNDNFSDPWNFLHVLRLDGYVSAGDLHAIHVTKSPAHVWTPGLRATLHSSPRQVIYSVRQGGA